MNPNDKSRNWSNFDQSRPHVCQVPHLNLVIINLFYYGFRDRDELDLWDWKHFYPPHLIEGTLRLRSGVTLTRDRSLRPNRTAAAG